MNGLSVQSSSSANLLPSATSVVNLADSHDRAAFAMVARMKEEPMDVESLDANKEDVSVMLSCRNSIIDGQQCIFSGYLVFSIILNMY